MSGLSDEAIIEGHDLVDAAEHEAQADPSDFKKVHPVGETGGSILPDEPGASSGSAQSKPSVVHTLESKLGELKDKLVPK